MKLGKGLLLGVLMLSMLVPVLHGTGLASAATFEEKIQASQERKAELEQLLLEAEEQKAAFEEHKKQTQETLDGLAENIENLSLYIQELDQNLADCTAHLETLEQTIAEKEKNLELTEQMLLEAIATEEEQYETMKKRIRYIYENGSTSFWDILVSADSLTDILNRAEYRMRIAEYDNSLLERYTLSKELVETNKAYQEAALQELYRLKEEAEYEEAAYLALSAEKAEQIQIFLAEKQINEEMLKNYGEEIVNQEIAIEELYEQEAERAEEEARIRAEEEERIRKEEEERRRREEEERKRKEEEERLRREAEERARLEEELRRHRLSAAEGIELTLETSISKMIWPLPGDGRVFDGFGPREAPLPGASTFHKGVDLGGEYGAAIVSVLAGTVETVGYDWQSGNKVVVDHGNGVMTKYLHCSSILVKEGDFVMQGEVIAKVGSTGVSTSPHLHFAVLINGTHVDPMKYISYE